MASDNGSEPKTPAIGQATNAAYKRLKEAHPEEFNQYKAEEARQLGLDWTPRMTDQQRAEKKMREIADQYPDLVQQVVGSTSVY